MDQQENITPALAPKKKRKSKALPLDLVNKEHESENKMSTEHEDLNLHVSLCEQRYKELEKRLDGVEARLAKVEADISALKVSMSSGFSEIKILLERQNSRRQTQLIASMGAIAVAVISALGYIISRT